MNCDQVFDALTRGPFPTGSEQHDQRVERHLARCGSCRRLAAALQPAVELFEEAVSPEESCGLPAYWGELFSQCEPQGTTRIRAPRLLRRASSSRSTHSSSAFRLEQAWRVAAALLLGMAIGGVLRAALRESDQPGTMIAGGSRQQLDRGWKFEALGMTAACGPLASLTKSMSGSTTPKDLGLQHGGIPGEPPLAAEGGHPGLSSLALRLAEQKCCTECHHAGAAIATPQVARAGLANSCELCHVGSPKLSNGGGD